MAKINARNLVADIHAGVTLDQICKRYQISEGQFRLVFDQLVKAKLLLSEEFPERGPGQQKSLLTTREIPSFKCPHCGMLQIEGTEVCHDCGIVMASHSRPKTRPSNNLRPPPSRGHIWGFPRAAVFAAGILVVTILGIYGFFASWSYITYYPMRSEIKFAQEQIQKANLGPFEALHVTERFIDQFGRLKQRLDDSDMVLVLTLKKASILLSSITKIIDQRDSAEMRGDYAGGRDWERFRRECVHDFISSTNEALRLMK